MGRLRVIPAMALAVLLIVPPRAIGQTDAAETADTTPRVTSELSPESVVVGQPAVLRVTILVPTWLPEPPAFPALDLPNVIVRLPERATNPVSERVDGDTWSGVSRAYRLYPMIPGEIALPPQQIGIIYADPETTEPLSVEVTLDATALAATVPEAAAGLDPLILASGVTLEQTVEGADGPLGAGDAVVRTVTATIKGTTPLFLPPLIPALEAEPVQAHAKDPVVKEQEDRGVLSGSRAETVTYVARYGGSVDMPAISLDWFNVESGEVETATVEGVTLEVDAPAPPRETRFSVRQAVLLASAVAVSLALAWLVVRYALPPLRRWIAARRESRQASEAFAAREVHRAIAARDLQASLNALATWSARAAPIPGKHDAAISAALHGIGAARFGGRDGSDASAWQNLNAAFSEARRAARRPSVAADALPPLNPS